MIQCLFLLNYIDKELKTSYSLTSSTSLLASFSSVVTSSLSSTIVITTPIITQGK